MIDADELMRKAKEKRKRNEERKKRRMELGYDGWQMREDGSFFKHEPKGIQHWHNTRTLIDLVSKRMDSVEAHCGERYCPINGRWMLQIRGKHLRRLMKVKPEWKQVGSRIVEVKK